MSGLRSALPPSSLVACCFVDAGFLREIGAALLGLKASEVTIVGPELVARMYGSALPHRLLRTHVYDGRFDHEHHREEAQRREFTALADTEELKLRLGTLRERRGTVQQKGVDTLLVLDMLQMAQTGAYDEALLLAGDADFSELVEAVQRLGRRVRLVVDDHCTSVARELRQAADLLERMPDIVLTQIVVARP